jgi:ubiquinone/menaquinone biosynthesis C-methylase UbiE
MPASGGNDDMGRLYDFYEKRIFPHGLELAMRPMWNLRPGVLEDARGEVLEIGFGTGLNLPHYPATVSRLVTADPMEAVPAATAKRIKDAPFPIDIHHLPADGGLPFEDGRFDRITITWTLCTIPDPVSALREARRVIKADGRMLFIEHGRSNDPKVARWQDRWNPVQKFIACGCNVNRKIDDLIETAGFTLENLDRFCVDGVPRLFGETYRGVARPDA